MSHFIYICAKKGDCVEHNLKIVQEDNISQENFKIFWLFISVCFVVFMRILIWLLKFDQIYKT